MNVLIAKLNVPSFCVRFEKCIKTVRMRYCDGRSTLFAPYYQGRELMNSFAFQLIRYRRVTDTVCKGN